MRRNGFTVIELAIVITIMGILLVLGSVNFNESQANARDSERKADVESIIIHLDTFYDSGSDDSTSLGTYPSTLLVNTVANLKKNLRDMDEKSITAPGSSDPTTTWKVASSNTVQDPSTSEYIYQPLKSDGSLCVNTTDECRKFKIFYKLEVDGLVYIATGKNQ